MGVTISGITSITQYYYDAEGQRAGKAALTWIGSGSPNLSNSATGVCGAPESNSYWTKSIQSIYLLDLGGQQVTELNGAGTWQHSNVWNGPRLTATYNSTGIHFYIADPLGTKRVQASSAGLPELNCLSLPYGNDIGNPRQTDCVVPPGGTSAADASEIHFTGKERDTESGNDYFSARYYASSMGRFMSPDPMGGHYENPQTLNKYAYVINNPLTMTDPTGLDIWLKGCGDNSATCQNNYAGTTDKDGAFSRTHLTGDQTGDATLGAHGISVTVGSGDSAKTYAGVWDTNKGEGGTVTVAGAGALSGYKADVTGNCGGTCVASGSITSMNPNSGNITKALFGVLDTKSSGYVKNAGTDAMNFFHPGATNFRGHASGDPSGMPSTHIPIDPKASLPNNEWHVDGSFPYDGVKDWLTHAGCATGASCDPTK